MPVGPPGKHLIPARKLPAVGTIIGRDEELERTARFLQQAREQRVARVLRVTGASGNGKTALAGAIQERAHGAGWVVPFVAAHRIQATLPLIVARRLAEETTSALGEGAARYTSGLETVLRDKSDSAAFESAFFRLAEAVLLDYPLACIIDDAQWIDRESSALLLRTIQFYADRPLVLIVVDRSDGDTEPVFEYIDETIAVREFAASTAEHLAKTLMPSASDDVIRAVAHQTRGRAIDIKTIAALSEDHAHLTEEAVAASARSIVASTIARLKPETREFLQMCALIGDPIELPILHAIWPDEELITLIRECSGHYLVQDGGNLRFLHVTIMQSVRETLSIPIPYRKRIIAAIESLPQRTIERLERLVEQAEACGDRDLELKYLHSIVEEGERASLLDLVGSALQRIIAITPFSDTTLKYYERLSIVRNIIASDGTAAICRDALGRSAQAGYVKGLGQITASLLFSLWHNDDRKDFWAELTKYDRILEDPADRGHLTGVKMYAALAQADPVAFATCSQELSSSNISAPMIDLRARVFRSQLCARSGDVDGWEEHRREAHDIVERFKLSNIFSVMSNASDAIFYFHTYGAASNHLDRALSHLPPSETLRDHIESLRLMASGSPSDTVERIQEQLQHKLGAFARRISLGIAGAALALAELTPSANILQAIEREADSALRGNETPVLLPALCAAAALTMDQSRASRYVELAARLARQTFEPQIFWLPIVLVRAAQKCKRTDILEMITKGEIPHDQYPWSKAQHDLAIADARRTHELPVEKQLLSELEATFRFLGAPFFASLVPATKNSDVADANNPAASLILSRREREVARLISEGLTNREIAERLVLSERTVEGHVSNIFNKLNVGARSQVAVWFVANATLVRA